MYFEGRCYAVDFAQKIKELVLKPDLTMSSPQPLWEDISSNNGTSSSDNGLVFKARFIDNDSVWGIKNGSFSSSYFYLGPEIFVASRYKPGTPGLNGTFSKYYNMSMVLAGYGVPNSLNNLPIRYWISVKRDRVIIAYKSEIQHTSSRTNVIYVGQPAEYHLPTDKGFVLGAALGNRESGNGINDSSLLGRIGMTGDYFNTDVIQMDVGYVIPQTNKTWGTHVYPHPINLYYNNTSVDSGGVRAALDLLVLRQDGKLRAVDNVFIGGKDYLAIEVVGYDQTTHPTSSSYRHYNNFVLNSSGRHLLLFSKD